MATNKRGFTLVELIVVMAVLAVLVVVILAAMNPVTQLRKSRDARRKSDLREIKTSLTLYFNIYGEYPNNDGSNKIIGCGEPASTCEWDSRWERGSVVFMKLLPGDPLGDPHKYRYTRIDFENFYLIATLEIGDNDPSAPESRTRCNVGSQGEYVVCNE